MTLTPGTTLGPYKILGPLGAKYAHQAATTGGRRWGELLGLLPEVRTLLLPHPDTVLRQVMLQPLRTIGLSGMLVGCLNLKLQTYFLPGSLR